MYLFNQRNDLYPRSNGVAMNLRWAELRARVHIVFWFQAKEHGPCARGLRDEELVSREAKRCTSFLTDGC